MTTAQKLAASLAVLLVASGGGYLAGRRSAPARVETRERVVDREVVKEVVKWRTRTVVKRDVRREVVTVTRPDGTRETRALTDFHTDRMNLSLGNGSRDTSRETVQERSGVTVRDVRPRWMLGVTASSALRLGALEPSWGVEGKVRALGPFWLGVGVEPAAKRGTVSLGVAF
jgi:hypothetical protein